MGRARVRGRVIAMFAYALLATMQEGAETEHALPMDPWVFGVLAIVAFAVLLGITWSFKSVGQRHGEPRL
jgi:hypothetical protein